MHPLKKTATVIAPLIGGALLVAATTAPADATPRPVIDLRGAEVGTFAMDESGSARLEGRVTGAPFDGIYTAVLTPVDGTLPAAGECEPATATMRVVGLTGKRFLHLVATGTVCGTWPDAAYVVTHDFVGRYDVVASTVRRVRGTDGWISMVLATEGRANVEAIDT
jgi:hypothetical protein